MFPPDGFLPSFLEEERGKKDGRGKNGNKENMGGGQKRENEVFTRKLSPVFVSSVRSSNSHPDLLLTHHHPTPPHFFRSHRSSTLDFHFLSHYSYIKAIMLYKGKTWQDSGILWHTLAHSGILWHTLAYSDILWHTLAYSGILWHTLAYSCILLHTLAYSGLLWHTLA